MPEGDSVGLAIARGWRELWRRQVRLEAIGEGWPGASSGMNSADGRKIKRPSRVIGIDNLKDVSTDDLQASP